MEFTIKEEFLYPLPSVKAFVNEDLEVYKMDEKGYPNIDLISTVGILASDWVNNISKNDDTLLSELIYWNERELN